MKSHSLAHALAIFLMIIWGMSYLSIKLVIQEGIELSIDEMFKKFESQYFYTKVIYNGETEYENSLLK